jgi:hypothetical protein
MVDKKSPVKRLSVAKSTRAPRIKKLNLDKLITSIKKISTRYKKNGKMTGGAPDPIDKAMDEIKAFFMDKNPTAYLGARGGGETALTKVLKEISIIRGIGDKKQDLSDNIKSILEVGSPPTLPDSLTYIINNIEETDFNALTSGTKDTIITKRMEYFQQIQTGDKYDGKFAPPKFNNSVALSALGKTSEIKKAVAYISIFQIAHTLATIYNVLNSIK